MYLTQDGGELVVLFGGGAKRTQPSDIAIARAMLTEYKARKKAAVTPGRKGKAGR